MLNRDAMESLRFGPGCTLNTTSGWHVLEHDWCGRFRPDEFRSEITQN